MSYPSSNVNKRRDEKVKLFRRKKFVKSFSALSILVLCCLNFAPNLFNKRVLEALRELYPVAKKWKDKNKPADVPRLIHFMLLSENTPEHFVKMVEFNAKVAKENDFEVIEWRDRDVDMLVKFHQYKFPGLKETWEKIKDAKTYAKEAVKADFARNVVIWALGGVYLDADFIACSSIDFMVDKPGVISFPIMPQDAQDISSAAMSAPPHHRLFELLLETFIDNVDELHGSENVIFNTRPHILPEIIDEYFKEIGVSIESIHEGINMPFAAKPVEGVVDINEDGTKGPYEATVADIRFRADTAKHDLYHIGVKSWVVGQEMRSICFDNPSLLTPFLEETCNSDLSKVKEIDFVTDCGSNVKRRDLETDADNLDNTPTVDDDYILDYAEEERAQKAFAKNPIYRRLLKMCEENGDDYCPSFKNSDIFD